jgi:hypothetical protein
LLANIDSLRDSYAKLKPLCLYKHSPALLALRSRLDLKLVSSKLSQYRQILHGFCYIAIIVMIAEITQIRKQRGKLRKQIAILLAENTKINARITELRKQTGFRRKQTGIWLGENTKINARITEMKK